VFAFVGLPRPRDYSHDEVGANDFVEERAKA